MWQWHNQRKIHFKLDYSLLSDVSFISYYKWFKAIFCLNCVGYCCCCCCTTSVTTKKNHRFWSMYEFCFTHLSFVHSLAVSHQRQWDDSHTNYIPKITLSPKTNVCNNNKTIINNICTQHTNTQREVLFTQKW